LLSNGSRAKNKERKDGGDEFLGSDEFLQHYQETPENLLNMFIIL
jgi:hypothetical protein